MATKGHNILTLSIESLLNGDDQYVIPVYQRNYAWQEEHISQLIQDIIDYIPKSGEAQDYYIGTLVAYERKIGPELFFETIDALFNEKLFNGKTLEDEFENIEKIGWI